MTQTRLGRKDWSIQTKELRFSWAPKGNSKTRIPTSKTGSVSCPPGCPFLGSGCYAETAQSGTRVWREISTDENCGLSLSEFAAKVEALRPDSLWRHNEAGDLPGIGDRIDPGMLSAIVRANVGRRGFTYTHKPVLKGKNARQNRKLISGANKSGFTINLSADGIDDIPGKLSLDIGPVAVVIPENAPRTMRTGNVRILTCPAEYSDKTCRDCGWCQRETRSFVVGFHAHGVRKRMVSEIVA